MFIADLSPAPCLIGYLYICAEVNSNTIYNPGFDVHKQEVGDLLGGQRVHHRHQMLVRSHSLSAMDVIHRFLREYNPIIVNRLETQTRQPSLYFAAILIDHEQSYELMKLLIEHGANAHFKDNYQQTILFYVCREGKEKCLDLLLEQGLNLNDEDIYGQTPLYYAAKENRLNIIHKLIEKESTSSLIQ